MRKYTNKLIDEKSPYLLQHAFNPVEWFPWGSLAFEKAQKEDKPIFLSIGYSTCHWCHVMEQESFQDEAVAALMNEVFVAVKVDREERPDIDNVYMTVCQMLTGSGGWPLTIIMTSDKKPFFAATYIPKESRFGHLGLLELIPRIHSMWRTQRERLYSSAEEITTQLRSSTTKTSGAELGVDFLQRAYGELSQRFDENRGGFSEAPKFPSPHNLLFLLRYYFRTKKPKALLMVEKTLDEMSRGGIYDHIGFGLHRYSTDADWLAPHFEKMLYDQAMLILAYAEVYQLTRKNHYAHTLREIVSYVLREMTSPQGGFYSAEDADSDGQEGMFYLWSKEEIQKCLGEEAEWFCLLFHVSDEGNFIDAAKRCKTGANILHRRCSLDEFAAAQNISSAELSAKLEMARKALFREREKRIHPYKDDKILVDWNGLMIAALATAGRILDEAEFIEAAEKSCDFIISQLKDKNGRLYHRYRDGQAAIPAFIDDYAFLIYGLIELHQSTQNVRYLQEALDLNDLFVQHFWDDLHGGFFSTAEDGEELLVRHKDIYDGAIPSGNSVAMFNLIRLARLTGRADYEKKADQLGRVFSPSVSRMPSAFTFLLSALDFALGPAYEVVIVGDPDADDTKEMLKVLKSIYAPNTVVIFKSAADESIVNELSKFVRDYGSLAGKATAYVCQEFSCRLPTTSVAEMLQLLT